MTCVMVIFFGYAMGSQDASFIDSNFYVHGGPREEFTYSRIKMSELLLASCKSQE